MDYTSSMTTTIVLYYTDLLYTSTGLYYHCYPLFGNTALARGRSLERGAASVHQHKDKQVLLTLKHLHKRCTVKSSTKNKTPNAISLMICHKEKLVINNNLNIEGCL